MTVIDPTEVQPARPIATPTRSRPLTDAVVAVGVGVVLGWLSVAAGAVMILVGYLRVESSDSLAEQFAYFSSACVGGLALIGIGGLAVLARQHADARRAVEEIRRRHRGEAPARQRHGFTAAPDGQRVAPSGSSTYHHPDCVFVAGRDDLQRVDDLRGMRPCQVCAAGA